MRKIREVLRCRYSTGLSLEAIARALKLSKGVVAKYLKLASAAGLTWPIPETLDDAGLERLLYRQVAARESTFAEPDYARVHQELKQKGVTLTPLETMRRLASIPSVISIRSPERRPTLTLICVTRLSAPTPYT